MSFLKCKICQQTKTNKTYYPSRPNLPKSRIWWEHLNFGYPSCTNVNLNKTYQFQRVKCRYCCQIGDVKVSEVAGLAINLLELLIQTLKNEEAAGESSLHIISN